MRKLHALFEASLLFSLIVVSAGFAQVPGDTLWTDRYDDYSSLTSLAHAADGNFVHVAVDAPTVVMTWVNDNGDILNTTTFQGTGEVRVQQIIEYTDGGYLLTGETGETQPGTGNIWVVRTDASGNVLWEHEWNSGGSDRGIGITIDDLGNIAVTGWVFDAELISQAFIWKLTPDGETIFQTSYGGVMDDVCDGIITTSDGGFLIIGRTTIVGSGFDGWVVKTDSNGSVQWEQTYGTTDFEQLIGAVELDDGFILGGETGPFGDADAWLIKTDLWGNLLWDNRYGDLTTGWDVFNRISLAADGNVAFCGLYQSTGSTWNVWIGEIDIDGNLMWDANYGFNGFFASSSAVDFREIPEGGYMVCGFGNMAGWLLRIYDDPNPNSVDDSSSLYPIEFRLAKIYPNPFNAQAVVTVQLPHSADLNIAVFNVAGQQVAEIVNGLQSAGTHTFTFNASQLSSGLYFVRATVPGKMSEVQRMMLVR